LYWAIYESDLTLPSFVDSFGLWCLVDSEGEGDLGTDTDAGGAEASRLPIALPLPFSLSAD